MTLTDRLLNRVGYYKKVDTEKEKGKYQAVSLGSTKGGGLSVTTRDVNSLTKFREYYENEGTVFAAINNIADNVTMVGYHLSSKKDKAKEIIQNYIDELELEEILLDSVTHCLIYGDAFIEIVRGKKTNDIVDLNIIDPISVVIDEDEYGKVTGYRQVVQGETKKNIKPEFVIHIKLFKPNPSSPYGWSIIAPSLSAIDRMMGVDDVLYQAVSRHIVKYHVQIGTPEDLPPKEVFTDMKSELDDLESKNEIITTGLVNIKTIDERGVQGVSEYASTFEEKTLIGMMIAPEAVGRGQNSTEASARVREILYERFIRGLQTKVANRINKDLINQILEFNNFDRNIVKLHFKGTTTSDEEGAAKWIGNLFRGYPEGKKPLTINEVRSKFGYPPIEGGDDLIEGTVPVDDEEKPDDEGNVEEIKPPVNQPAD